MGAASYVTGAHAFKAGFQYGNGYFWRQRREAADLIQLYRSGVPSQVIIHNTPQDSWTDMDRDLGIFAQDQWTLGRLTINPGVRFENFVGSTQQRSALPGRFVPFRTFPARENVPNWKDVSPRLGFALDVMGDGKTAIKAGWGKYMRAYGSGFSDTYDPNFYTSATLTWTDLNSAGVSCAAAGASQAGCDNIAQGGINYLTDGTRVPCTFNTVGCEIDFRNLSSTFGVKPQQNFASDIQRPFQYEMNISVQREIVPGSSVTVAFVRRDYKNLIWSDNIAVDPSDYTKFTVQNPLDATKTVDIYNLSTTKASAFNALDDNSSQNSRTFTGLDFTFQTRMRGLNLFGGYTMGHTVSNTCQVEDPNFLSYCDQSQYDIPMYGQFKLNGSYTLPWKLMVSASVQSYNGDARNATVDGAIAAVDPSLRVIWNVDRATFNSATAKAGYNNGAGATLTQSSVNVQLIAPGTKLLGRHNQADIRLKRPFTIGRVQLEGQFDAYNALNSGVVLTRVQTFGSALDRPATILQGRLIRIGMQMKF